MKAYESWALRPSRVHRIAPIRARVRVPDFQPNQLYLAYGNGRSYGDSCLNANNWLIPTRALDRFIDFNTAEGTLRCEAGVTLEEILRLVMPWGWFLPVTPGTQFVTVGGAVANDVHGKNHHGAGTFGCHVTELELIRSDRGSVRCSSDVNRELFAATIGGLGLTGLITWVTLRLKRVSSTTLLGEEVKFRSLEEFQDLSRQSDESHEYTVAWFDCLSSRGRGVLLRGNHASGQGAGFRSARRITVPTVAPLSLINSPTTQLMNHALYSKRLRRVVKKQWHFQKFFYPLDGVRSWNRLYGPRGFYQFQCVLPMSAALFSLYDVLRIIRRARQGSFLAVLKTFGDIRSPGMLSFPRPGVTIAIDFPNAGLRTIRLLAELEAVVASAGGAIYPAKDATMSPRMFGQSFPRLAEFTALVDPHFSSSFWRRVVP